MNSVVFPVGTRRRDKPGVCSCQCLIRTITGFDGWRYTFTMPESWSGYKQFPTGAAPWLWIHANTEPVLNGIQMFLRTIR